MEVTDVLRDRMQEPGGLQVTAFVSLLVHAAVVGALILGPLRWVSHTVDENKHVMTISLGGAGVGVKPSRFDVQLLTRRLRCAYRL